MREGTAVGLDVHARSVWAAMLDCVTGEVCSRRVPATCEGIVEWARGLPGPVRVAYEAGPTGFGLARALEAVGIAVRGGGAERARAGAGGSGQDRSA